MTIDAGNRSKPSQGLRRLAPLAVVGAIAGIDNVASCLGVASLIFTGSLATGLGIGVSVMLLGGGVLALVVALRSLQPNAVAMVQETSIAILAAAVMAMATRLVAPAEVKIATALAILGTASVVTGGLFWLAGWFRLGVLARFLPFPVVAGFLAGSGWLLVTGAVFVATGGNSYSGLLLLLHDPDVVWRLISTFAFAGTMVLAVRRFPGGAIAPIVMLAAAALFYVALALLGIDLDQARAHGHLPVMPDSGGIALPGPQLLALIDWAAVLRASPSIFAAAGLSIIGCLLNMSALELASGRDVNANAELRATGLANMLSGSFGGPSGYHGLSMTLLADKMGLGGRGAGLATAVFMVVGLFVAQPLISHTPVFLTAGFVLFLGFELLGEWLIRTRRQLPVIEWLIVVLILGTVAFTGFVEGIAVGLLVSISVFVFNYSRLPVVRMSATGVEQRSTVDRSPASMKHLARVGDVVEVVQLQGYLFFGTADRMVEHVRRRLSSVDRAPLRFLVLDFGHVSGIDSAAATCFLKVRGLVEPAAVKIYLSHVAPETEQILRQAGLEFGPDRPLTIEPDMDHALEKIEELLLTEAPDFDPSAGLIQHLVAAIGPHPRMTDLVATMTRMSLEPEAALIMAGDDANDVYFVAKGRVRIQVQLPNGRTLRLRTMIGGAIVGEIALYLHQKRTADVIAETPVEVFRLNSADLARLEREDPEVAILAHRLLASNLAEKLSLATRMIQQSQR
jgi:SulP family sulfate permease